VAQPDRSNQARGAFGEDLAAAWYRRLGFEVLDRNWRCSAGELDLVVRAGDLVVFCEVKARRSDGFGGAVAAVDHRKQARVRRLGAAWLAAHPEVAGGLRVRFDVVAVTGGRVACYEDAF
jgi:putative endonuclease